MTDQGGLETKAHALVEEYRVAGKSAVLIAFQTPKSGVYAIHDTKVSIECIGSDDMTAADVRQVLQSVAILSRRRESDENSDVACSAAIPHDFKGDTLGMSLEDFCQRHHREVEGHPHPAPFRSDQTLDGHVAAINREVFGDKPELLAMLTATAEQGDDRIETLLTESWHRSAGIISCRKEFPFELSRGTRKPETIAGIETELVLYRFVDESLYQMLVYFETEHFRHVLRALREKHGEPDHEEKKQMHLMWYNGLSSVSIKKGSIRPKRSSFVAFTHHELLDLVNSRSPDPTEDM